MTKEVWKLLYPDTEPTQGALEQLESVLTLRTNDDALALQYDAIDQALVDLGYATDTETAASENAIDLAYEQAFNAGFEAWALSAFSAYMVFNAIVGMTQDSQ